MALDAWQDLPDVEQDESLYKKLLMYQCNFFPKSSNDNDEESSGSKLLFPDSNMTAKDACRFLLHLKSSNAVIGDRLFASIVGSVAGLLPKGNALAKHIQQRPSMYKTLQTVESMADVRDTNLRVFAVDTCKKGCRPFWNALEKVHRCPTCNDIRWKTCTNACFVGEERSCNHAEVCITMYNHVIICHSMYMLIYAILCHSMYMLIYVIICQSMYILIYAIPCYYMPIYVHIDLCHSMLLYASLCTY